MPRPRPFTDDELREAASASKTLNEVARRLGLSVGGRTYGTLRRRIACLGLQTPESSTTEPRPWDHRRRSWSDDNLRDAVRRSRGIADVLRRLGYRPSGGTHRWIRAKIVLLEIDTSHFTGQSWARGQTFAGGGRRARPLAEILVDGSTHNSGRLRQRLVAAGLKDARCEICGIDTWRGEPLPLALDHVNGRPTDNRLENLRILCPNCHALTDTWCARNRKHAGRRTPTQRDQT